KLQFQLRDESLLILDTYKSKLNPNTYKLLELQVMGALGYELGRALVGLHRYAGNKNDEVIKSYLRMFMNNYFEQVSSAILHIDESSISSPRFIDYLVEYTWLSFVDQYKGGGNVVKEWYELSKKLVNSSPVRDRILASILMKRFQDKPQEDLLADAFLTLKDPLSLHKIATLKNLIKGTYAYKFSLPDVFGKFYKADDYKGKVIFMDFWYASCLPCRDYMRNVVGPLKKIYKNNTDVVFITVSTDKFEVFKTISKKDDFFIDGGVNLYTNNELFKHPIIQYYQIRSYPYPLLIGKDGKLLTGLFDLKSIEGLKYAIDTALK
ncbi:TlpA family protein disulfide reductase, partial [Sphingobacterium faecale]